MNLILSQLVKIYKKLLIVQVGRREEVVLKFDFVASSMAFTVPTSCDTFQQYFCLGEN